MVRKFLKEKNGAELYFYPGTDDKVHIEWSRGHNPDFVVVRDGKSNTIDLSSWKSDYDGMHALFKEHFDYRPELAVAQAKVAEKADKAIPKSQNAVEKKEMKKQRIENKQAEKQQKDDRKPIKPLSQRDREFLLNLELSKKDDSLKYWLICTCSVIVAIYVYSNRRSLSQKCFKTCFDEKDPDA